MALLETQPKTLALVTSRLGEESHSTFRQSFDFSPKFQLQNADTHRETNLP